MNISRDEIMTLIARHSDRMEIAKPGLGSRVSTVWIEKAEQRIGTSLPESYKWYLRTYKGGSIAGEEIYTVYEKDFGSFTASDDIVSNYIINVRNGTFGPDKIVICDNGGEEIFYFATTQRDERGEWPVFKIDNIEGTEEWYAYDFLDFLRKRILFLCGD